MRRFHGRERIIDLATCYDRTNEELESFLLFAVCVAGKNAKNTDKALARFLPANVSPFAHLRALLAGGKLGSELRKARLGQYGRLEKAMSYLARALLNLRTCSVEDLEAVPGIGPKTARFFLLYTRRNARVAALDTHVLRYLRENGYEDAPVATPQGSRAYRKWEKIFLGLAGEDPASFDYGVWSSRSASSR